MKKPELRQRVRVYDLMNDHTYWGEVVDLLSVQFTYLTDQGLMRYAHYTDKWEVDSDA